VTSFAEPYVEDRTAGDWVCLIFSRDAFPDITKRLEAMASRLFPPSATTGVLADHILSLAARLPAAGVEEEPALAEMTRSILAGCLSRTDPSADIEGAGDAVRRAEVERVIRRNLGSARLDVDRICALARVSRSTLYRMFEGEGGVARYIQRCRLMAVQAALTDPACDRPIGAIAEDYGFYDPSAFSRSFRREFGMSPSEARASGTPAARIRNGGDMPGRTLRDCLRAF
jgi:AraC-like DNA-binding protein